MINWIFNLYPTGITVDSNERVKLFKDDNIKHVQIFIRELIQNFLDNRSKTWKGPQVLKIKLVTDDYDFAYLKKITKGLKTFLKKDGIEQKNINKQILIAEEFGATGFTGDLNVNQQQSNKDHARYWYHSGKIYEKKGSLLGGAGHGEITYPMSSEDNCSFVISVREDQKKNSPQRKYLYAKCNLLKPPKISNQLYWHTGYYGKKNGKNFPKPILDKQEIKEFSDAFSLERENEPGNSYVITRVKKNRGFSERELIISVIDQWFTTIATSDLVVHINDIKIDALKLMDEDFLSKYFSEEDSKFYFFCTERLSSTPIDIKLPDTCIGNRKIDIPEAYFNTKKLKRDLQKARKNFDDFSPITIQCPIYISRKSGKEYKQNFNVYIQKIEQGSTSKYLLLRQSLTLSAENNLTGIPGPVYAITSIQKPHVAKMLKSAEVPSHVYAKYTNASDAGYKYARETLSIIRNAANEIAKLLYNFESEIDLNSLSQLFPIAHSGSGAAGWVDPSSHKDKCLNCNQHPCICPCKNCNQHPCICPCKNCNQHPCICPKPLQQYIVKYISPGSYRVTNGRDPIKIFPFKIHLKFAFGTLAPGNQIKKYKPTDFDLSNAQAIDPNNLEVLRQGNDLILEIDSSSANFNYEISGLNTNFEFIIEGQL